MRFVRASCGTRGDVEPCAAVGRELPHQATGPSGLKGRYRDRYATDLRPALDPGASAAPDRAAARAGARRCPPKRAALNQQITTNHSLRFQGIATSFV